MKRVEFRNPWKYAIQQMARKMEIRRYAENTQRVYLSLFRDFARYHNELNPETISREQVITWVNYLVKQRNASRSYQNQTINAIKFYYEHVLLREKEFYDLDRPRKEKRLPTVLTRQEVKSLISHIGNLKHRCIIELIYSSGLRIGELLKLRLEDIDSERMLVKIRSAKGFKDRYTILSAQLLPKLREYYMVYGPKEYLFEGQNGGMYSAKSVQNIVRRTAQLSGIKKKVTTHTLRHSFATHLVDNGTNLRHIQTLLGHNSSRTTEIYTHVSNMDLKNIQSPLDSLDSKGDLT